jgi:hypothetical protein
MDLKFLGLHCSARSCEIILFAYNVPIVETNVKQHGIVDNVPAVAEKGFGEVDARGTHVYTCNSARLIATG